MNNIKEVLKNSADNICLDNFTEMYNCLKEINDREKQKKYKEDFKELIQLIIDYLIFGDKKKDQTYFDTFCELDFMKEFIVASKSRNIEILLQIIKSMSALILTITNKTSLFYIFSNNFINNIITNDDIQESSEDFLSFYVNFLKSLSLKIDTTTIQLFFQKEKNSFPLLENALKLYNNDDSMIKNVVRNIFLKFAGLSTEYPPLKEYLMSLPILKYFCFLSCRLTDMTLELNKLAGYNILYNYNLSPEFDFNYEKLKGMHDDLIDEILYLNDILSINDSDISFVLLNSLLYYYICPLLLGSLYNYKYFIDKIIRDTYINYLITPEISLYMLTLFLSNIHNDSLLNILCGLLFKYKINKEIITKFINIQFNGNCPKYPSNYCYTYKDQSYKEKKLTFVQYITYNFNKKFICNLIMKQNNKYYEVMELNSKYEKKFDSNFNQYENYDNIFKDVISYFYKKDKKFMRDYHNLISLATGIKSGLSENEYEYNVLQYLNEENNMVLNPFRIIILEQLFKCGLELINMGANILLYSMFYNLLIDENKNMNKSVSRKFLYYECNILPYEIFLQKNIINKNEENNINNINNEDKENDIEEENNDNIINTNNEKIEKSKIIQNNKNDKEDLLFKTEKYELKYKEKTDIYSENFNIDNDIINNLINLIKYSSPYCSLELLLMIYNIRYLSCSLENNENNNVNIDENDDMNIISKELIFTHEQKIKLIDAYLIMIERIKSFISNNLSFKYTAFESLEKAWNLYKNDYSFNSKNLIIKYILTPYYICIPSTVINIDDFPFKSNNKIYAFDTYMIGYLAIHDIIKNKISKDFPLENGIFEYKIGDKINIKNINIHSSKYKLLKILVKKNNKNEFEECVIFVNKNSIIFGNEIKIEENETNEIKIKSMHPLRELEICLDNSFPNSLQLYFKKNNYIIECESNERRKEIKAELERKRNEFRKWELDNILKLLDEEEKKYRKYNDNYKYNFYFGKKNKNNENDEKNGENRENQENLFNWD